MKLTIADNTNPNLSLLAKFLSNRLREGDFDISTAGDNITFTSNSPHYPVTEITCSVVNPEFNDYKTPIYNQVASQSSDIINCSTLPHREHMMQFEALRYLQEEIWFARDMAMVYAGADTLAAQPNVLHADPIEGREGEYVAIPLNLYPDGTVNGILQLDDQFCSFHARHDGEHLIVRKINNYGDRASWFPEALNADPDAAVKIIKTAIKDFVNEHQSRSSLDSLIAAAGEPSTGDPNKNAKEQDAR